MIPGDKNRLWHWIPTYPAHITTESDDAIHVSILNLQSRVINWITFHLSVLSGSLYFVFQTSVSDLFRCGSSRSFRNQMFLLHQQRHQGTTCTAPVWTSICSLHTNWWTLFFPLQAKEVAENTFLITLDSQNLSHLRSSLRYTIIYSFIKVFIHCSTFCDHGGDDDPLLSFTDLNVNSVFKLWIIREGMH